MGRAYFVLAMTVAWLTAYGEGETPEVCAYKLPKPDPAVWTYMDTNNLWRIDLGDHSKFDGNALPR